MVRNNNLFVEKCFLFYGWITCLFQILFVFLILNFYQILVSSPKWFVVLYSVTMAVVSFFVFYLSKNFFLHLLIKEDGVVKK